MVVVAAEKLSGQENNEPNAASPDERKLGRTLLRIGTRYSVNYSQLSVEHCGFVDLKGKIVIEPQWEHATDFRESYAAVQHISDSGALEKVLKSLSYLKPEKD